MSGYDHFRSFTGVFVTPSACNGKATADKVQKYRNIYMSNPVIAANFVPPMKEEFDDGGSLDSNESRKESPSPIQSRGSTRGVTLKVLIQENILEPGNGVLTIDYLGNKFSADLSKDGKIFWKGMQFASPSSWAIHVKKQINPSKKSGCGWNSVKYRGKKLDIFKSIWSKKNNANILNNKAIQDDGGYTNVERKIMKYSQLKPTQTIEPTTLIESVQYDNLGHGQHFAVQLSMNCKLLMDFHCHLSTEEVIGYLGGKWDHNEMCIKVEQAFPCRCKLGDIESAKLTERKIQNDMNERGLQKVGWYHSHPNCLPEPTLRDIECQWEFQNKFKSVVGIICSPYIPSQVDSAVNIFWVAPSDGFSTGNTGCGKPMNLKFNETAENQILNETYQEMSHLIEYYKTTMEVVRFSSMYNENLTYGEKLKQSLGRNIPGHFINELFHYVNQLISLSP